LQKQARDNKELSHENRELRSEDRELHSEVAEVREAQAREHAAQQREIDVLKQKDASINTLSERLAALEQQVRTATSARFDSLAKK